MGTSLKKVAKKAKDYKYVLLVMRHAKTEPFGDGGDAGRELTDKGRKQAKAVAKGLAAHKMVPTRIACSSATRARQTKEKHRELLVLGHEPTVSIACQWLASSESDAMLLDMLNLGMSPASLAVFGSNEPFNQWQLHSGELIALLTAKDFE